MRTLATLATLLVGLAFVFWAPTAKASLIEREIVFTLDSSQLTPAPDNNGVPGVSFNPKEAPFCCSPNFQEVMPQTGDTLTFHIRFQDDFGNKQTVRIEDLGSGPIKIFERRGAV